VIVSQATKLDRIDPIEVDALESRLLGSLVRPGDEAYDEARQVHNVLFDRRPALIVRAADAADVIRAVEFAREHDLRLTVRSGGHSVAGYSTVDAGLVLDLSGMKSVAVDPVKQTAWIQPGAQTSDLVAATQPHGLTLSTGDTASVGIGGLATGGGIGWLARKHGLTIDSMIAAEIVTADGRLITASEQQNPDLFWAIRGGGGNFGVVTGFEFKLQLVGTVLGGALVLPLSAEVLRGYADYAVQARDELTTIATVMAAPPMPIIPVEAHCKPAFIVLFCYAGDLEEGKQALEPLRSLATQIAELIAPMPYPALYQFTEMAARRHPGHVRSGFMRELSDEAIESILDYVQEHPNRNGMVQLRGLGGALGRVPNEATAFAHRDKQIMLGIISVGSPETEWPWVRDLWQELQPMTTGVYVNFLDDEGEARVHQAYPGDTYARLAEVKRRYDPTNLFNLNQNVKPE
jgi:FAD binding domain/Berberine and berberine like